MFDWFEPVPAIDCPLCGERLDDWQGKDAVNLLLVWRQGVAAAVDWRVPPEVQVPQTFKDRRLPARFAISKIDSKDHRIKAAGLAPDGVWSATELISVTQLRRSRNGTVETLRLWSAKQNPRPVRVR